MAQTLARFGLPLYRRLFQPTYGICQRLGKMLAEDPVVALSEFEGIFAIGPRSHLLFRVLRTGAYEPRLAECVLRYLAADRDAIDVGANVGFYTVLMAQHVPGGRVLAVEPAQEAVRRLRRNLVLNKIPDSRAIVHEGAVSKTGGKVRLRTVEGNEEYSTIGELSHLSVAGAPQTTCEVDCATLDELVRRYGLNPGFIKIDAEGAEQWVIEGARETLGVCRPVVLLEVSGDLMKRNGCDPARLSQMLRDWGYGFRDPRTLAVVRSLGSLEEALLLPEGGTP